MATTLEELVLRITADSRQLRSELRKSQAIVRTSANNMQKAFEPLRRLSRTFTRGILPLTGIVSTAAALSRLQTEVDATVAGLDRLDKVSTRLGISTEFLQTRIFALSQAGIDARTSELALQRFFRRSGEAADGTGEAVEAFRALGIELRNTDGTMRDLGEVFDEAIVKLSQVEDANTKLALAFKFFDSEGARLVQVADSYRELTDAAVAAGVAVDEAVIQQAADVTDKADEMARVLRARLAPSFTEIKVAAIGALESILDLFGLLDSPAEKLLTDLAEVRQELASLDDETSAGNRARSRRASLFNVSPEAQEEAVRERRRILLEREAELERELFELGEKRSSGRVKEFVLENTRPRLRPTEDVKADAAREAEFQRQAAAGVAARNNLIEAQFELIQGVDEWKEASTEATDTWIEGLKETSDFMEGMGDQLVNGLSAQFAELVVTGEASFKQLGEAFVREFIQRALKELVFSQLFSFLGNLAGGLFGGGKAATPGSVDPAIQSIRDIDFFGGFSARQSGGPVSVGRLYRVNDGAGTELFQPSVQGSIVPAGRAGSSGFTLNVYNSVSDEVDVRSRENPDTRAIEIEIVRAASNDVRKRGDLAASLESTYGLKRRGIRRT